MSHLQSDARRWSTAQVAAWIRSLGPPLNKFEGHFEFTTGAALFSQTDESLSKLGVSVFGARQSLLAAIGELGVSPLRPAPAVDAPFAAPAAGSKEPALPSPAVTGTAPPLPPGYLYHAFISYREIGGTNLIPAYISSELRSRGYKVFFDQELDARLVGVGDSSTTALSALRASCCDVLVMTSGTLDNYWRSEDKVRLEIAEACHLGKAIIPVVADSSVYPYVYDRYPYISSRYPYSYDRYPYVYGRYPYSYDRYPYTYDRYPYTYDRYPYSYDRYSYSYDCYPYTYISGRFSYSYDRYPYISGRYPYTYSLPSDLATASLPRYSALYPYSYGRYPYSSSYTYGLSADIATFPRHNAVRWDGQAKAECVNTLAKLVDIAVQGVKPFDSIPPLRRAGAVAAPVEAGAGTDEVLVQPGVSIMDVVRRARPGQTIRLAPGRYMETLRLDKEVHIVGPREAVLEWGDCVTLHCAYSGSQAPSVKGITIRNTDPRSLWAAVWITAGSRAVLEGCDVSGAGKRGVEVSGAGTEPTLRSNVVHDCGMEGIVFTNWARGTAEGNEVFGNKEAGIAIYGGADPVVRGNKIHDQEKRGIRVYYDGKGVLAGNTIERVVGGKAIEVEPDSRGCRVEGNTTG